MTWDRVVRARMAAVFAAIVLAGILLGCMNISIGGRTYSSQFEDGVFVQSGEAHLPAGCEQDIFYPIPFAATPNLEVDKSPFHQMVVVEQHADHFRVRNSHSHFGHNVEWKARGLKGTPPPAASATAP